MLIDELDDVESKTFSDVHVDQTLFDLVVGDADAVWRFIWMLEECPAAEYIILPGYHLYKMDYQEVLQLYHETGADITISALRSEEMHDKGFGIVKVNSENTVLELFEGEVVLPLETVCEVFVEHYCLEIDQAFITMFICLVPVVMDACVKLWQVLRSGWTRDMDNFFSWLSSITFSGGEWNDVATAVGLAEALMLSIRFTLEGNLHTSSVHKMKPEKQYLDKLTPSTKSYKVKVWVKLKGPATVSPKKKTPYQHLILKDEQGNTMKGALFGDQISEYENVLEKDGLYEIANAPLKPIDPKYLPKNAEHNVSCEMTFGKQTSIQLLQQPPGKESGSSSTNYCSIDSIPRTSGSDELFDVLGVVLFVEEPRTVTSRYGNPKLVREIIITDHSVERPLTITTWGELTGPECNLLSSWAADFLIIGFTCLQPSNYKGFSLGTSMGTTFEHHPTGEKADTLRAWVAKNRPLLEDRMAKVLQIRNPSANKTMLTIRDIDQKKAKETWQEERHWLRVTALDPNSSDVTAYIGCSKCGKRTSMEVGNTFCCEHCSRDGCQAMKRVTFRFIATDDTGTMKLTAFSQECEALFQLPVEQIYDQITAATFDFKSFSEKIQDNAFQVQVSPTTALTRSGALSWCLRSLSWN